MTWQRSQALARTLICINASRGGPLPEAMGSRHAESAWLTQPSSPSPPSPCASSDNLIQFRGSPGPRHVTGTRCVLDKNKTALPSPSVGVCETREIQDTGHGHMEALAKQGQRSPETSGSSNTGSQHSPAWEGRVAFFQGCSRHSASPLLQTQISSSLPASMFLPSIPLSQDCHLHETVSRNLEIK